MDDNTSRIFRLAIYENMVTAACIAVIVVGGWWVGMGVWSLLGFVLLLNLNNPQLSKKTEQRK